MIAVIFEVFPKKEHKQEYIDIAAKLKPLLVDREGFISIERFESLQTPGKILSLSFWENEESVAKWKKESLHVDGQNRGKATIFSEYRIRVGSIIRDYSIP